MPEQQKQGQQPQPHDMDEDVADVGGDPERARREGKPPAGDVREAYSSDRVKDDVEPEDAQPS